MTCHFRALPTEKMKEFFVLQFQLHDVLSGSHLHMETKQQCCPYLLSKKPLNKPNDVFSDEAFISHLI